MKPDQPNRSTSGQKSNDFQRQADQAAPGLVAEFFYFLLHNKKWWLIPIIVVLLVLGFLVVLGGSGLSWLMYTVF